MHTVLLEIINSFVDTNPDPVGSGTFWPGRNRIQDRILPILDRKTYNFLCVNFYFIVVQFFFYYIHSSLENL
jgi:hypothetical protein